MTKDRDPGRSIGGRPSLPDTAPVIHRRHLLFATASAVVLAGSGCSTPRGTPREQGTAPVSSADNPAPVEFRVNGETMRPLIELAEGSKAHVSWVDLDNGSALGSGLNPTLATEEVRRVGMYVVSNQTPAFEEVLTLNLGFHRDDDYGRLSLAPAYEHAPQPVIALTGLHVLTQLRRLCVSRTPLSGHLDLRDLSLLEHVESYRTEIQSIDLKGCSSLVRLCVEDCRLTELDLGPVRTTLQDLRAAIQRSSSLEVAPLDGPMKALYHYCIRDQHVPLSIPHRHLPVVEEYWVWATGQRSCDSPTSAVLRSYLARDNALDQASVDAVLTGLAALVTDEHGRVDVSGQVSTGEATAPPSKAGETAAGDLATNGWRVSTN